MRPVCHLRYYNFRARLTFLNNIPVRCRRKAWINERIRRVVPPPSTILQDVYNLLITFGPLKCTSSNHPLFDTQAWKDARNLLQLIGKGYLSDPPGVSLYIFRRRDENGLAVYHCLRGTNSLEGGVHQNLKRHFGAFNASPGLRLICSLNIVHDITCM